MQGMEQVPMEAVDLLAMSSVFRESLNERRQRLEGAIAHSGGDLEFTNLLDQVDAALAKLDNGTYGKCEECGDYLETDSLLADPLVRVCIDELSALKSVRWKAISNLPQRFSVHFFPE